MKGYIRYTGLICFALFMIGLTGCTEKAVIDGTEEIKQPPMIQMDSATELVLSDSAVRQVIVENCENVELYLEPIDHMITPEEFMEANHIPADTVYSMYDQYNKDGWLTSRVIRANYGREDDDYIEPVHWYHYNYTYSNGQIVSKEYYHNSDVFGRESYHKFYEYDAYGRLLYSYVYEPEDKQYYYLYKGFRLGTLPDFQVDTPTSILVYDDEFPDVERQLIVAKPENERSIDLLQLSDTELPHIDPSIVELVKETTGLSEEEEIYGYERIQHGDSYVVNARIQYKDDSLPWYERHIENVLVFTTMENEVEQVLPIRYEGVYDTRRERGLESLVYSGGYSVRFEDVSFDGEDDILISIGAGRNAYYCAYIYENGTYRYEPSFEEIPNANGRENNIQAYWSGGSNPKYFYYYVYQDGKFVLDYTEKLVISWRDGYGYTDYWQRSNEEVHELYDAYIAGEEKVFEYSSEDGERFQEFQQREFGIYPAPYGYYDLESDGIDELIIGTPEEVRAIIYYDDFTMSLRIRRYYPRTYSWDPDVADAYEPSMLLESGEVLTQSEIEEKGYTDYKLAELYDTGVIE